ncbi:hypothetical protein CYMTET_16947 [Cymbomonas tetramitiformis]|uniref:Acyltransferase 3 domain-containing protein n=1 Tax=Cymbomonas tetramitiformis TaxID=36881 RepID=A0AAE0GCE9_9CHLO|nr:hypothetical protein CYMTET_16947 [Cymbomonas tetramitiformis]
MSTLKDEILSELEHANDELASYLENRLVSSALRKQRANEDLTTEESELCKSVQSKQARVKSLQQNVAQAESLAAQKKMSKGKSFESLKSAKRKGMSRASSYGSMESDSSMGERLLRKSRRKGSWRKGLDEITPSARATRSLREVAAVNAIRCFALIFFFAARASMQSQNCAQQQWAQCSGLFASHKAQALFWPLGGVFNSGNSLGASLFFMCTGFVLYVPYTDPRGRRGTVGYLDSWEANQKYWLNRALRLFPVYFFAALTSWASNISTRLDSGVLTADIASHRSFWQEVVLELFSLNQFSHEHYFPWSNGDLWVMQLIIWFTLIAFPVMAWAFKWLGPFETTLGSFLVSLGVRCLTRVPSLELTIYQDFTQWGSSIFGWLDIFVLGMYVGYLYGTSLWAGNPVAEETLKKGGTLVQFVMGSTSYMLVYAGVLYSLDVNDKYVPSSEGTHGHYQEPYCYFREILFSFKSVGLAIGFVFMLRMRLRLFRAAFITNPLVQITGRMSMSIYVWHGMIFDVFYNQYSEHTFFHFFCFCVFLVPVSCISYTYLEVEGIRTAYKMLTSFPEYISPFTEGGFFAMDYYVMDDGLPEFNRGVPGVWSKSTLDQSKSPERRSEDSPSSSGVPTPAIGAASLAAQEHLVRGVVSRQALIKAFTTRYNAIFRLDPQNPDWKQQAAEVRLNEFCHEAGLDMKVGNPELTVALLAATDADTILKDIQQGYGTGTDYLPPGFQASSSSSGAVNVREEGSEGYQSSEEQRGPTGTKANKISGFRATDG